MSDLDKQTKFNLHMTIQDALRKVRIMLAVDEEIEVSEDIKMAEAKLIDGTEVYTEGAMEATNILYIKVEDEGDAPFATPGIHETEDGILITVGENGEIMEVLEKNANAVTEEVVEETMEEVIVKDVPEEAVAPTEDLLAGIADLLKPFTEEIQTLNEEIVALKARFSIIADEPAANPIRNTFSETKLAKENQLASRMEALRAIRNN
jgi:uncharacterized protein YuzE